MLPYNCNIDGSYMIINLLHLLKHFYCLTATNYIKLFIGFLHVKVGSDYQSDKNQLFLEDADDDAHSSLEQEKAV